MYLLLQPLCVIIYLTNFLIYNLTLYTPWSFHSPYSRDSASLPHPKCFHQMETAHCWASRLPELSFIKQIHTLYWFEQLNYKREIIVNKCTERAGKGHCLPVSIEHIFTFSYITHVIGKVVYRRWTWLTNVMTQTRATPKTRTIFKIIQPNN